MPVLYWFIWLISFISIGAFLLLLDGWIHWKILDIAALFLASSVTLGCFIFQVVSMSRDPYKISYASGLGGMPSTRSGSSRPAPCAGN